MKRLITLCIAVTVVALLAVPAFAEVQNVKVSGDINTSAVYREDYNLYPSGRSGATPHDNRTITNARVKVDADLTDNVAATIRMLSEWEWDTEANRSSGGKDIEMDLANVTLKEVFYQPLTAIVGRQELRLGNAFIIGDSDTNGSAGDANIGFADFSRRKSFDAVRTILDYNPLTIEAFWAKIDETGTTKDDEDLYGVNAAYQFDNYDAEAEAYWIFSRDDSEVASDPDTDALTPGHEIHTFGARGSLVPMQDLTLMGELAFQRGDFDKTATAKRDQDAYAFQVGGDYALQNIDWDPMIRASWTHYSGEEVANTGDHSAWLPLYEDQSHGVVANFILTGINGGQNSNADILNVGASATPMEDLTVSADVYWFWLDENLVSSDNATLTNSDPTNYVNLTDTNYAMKANDELGYEIDLALNYDYTEDVKMGISCGWFVPGEALEGVSGDNKNDETALQLMATLDVAF